jgi:hypothetical protein
VGSREWVHFEIFLYLYCRMQNGAIDNKQVQSKGWKIFKQMFEDKRAISEYLRNGGKLEDLKDKYKFVTPLSISTSKR